MHHSYLMVSDAVLMSSKGFPQSGLGLKHKRGTQDITSIQTKEGEGAWFQLGATVLLIE